MPAALSSFLSLLDVMMTRAPASLANWRAKMETPPVPCASTLIPGFKTQLVSAFQAVTLAHGRVVASSYEDARECARQTPEKARRSPRACRLRNHQALSA